MKKLTITTAILLIATVAYGQGIAINEDGAAPDPSAMLEVTSTEKGILIPRMTQAQREAISAPANGLLIYQSDETPGFYYNTGTAGETDWQRLGKSAEIPWAINGDDIYYQTGNVGIGTSTPQTKQHILGSGSASTPLLTIENTQDNATALSLKTIYRTWNIGQNMEGLPIDDFYIYDQTAGAARMVIGATGNVGIGVNNPLAQLHTNGSIRFSGAGTPGEGKVLTSDANGNATWEASNWIGSSYGTVVNPTTGKIWLDRNLGASQVATSSADPASYGDLYQWGRGADGHEKRDSPTTSTQASNWLSGSGSWDGYFIISYSNWLNSNVADLWSGTAAENNPCPSGFRVPTNAEWNQERLTWSSNNAAGAFASPLKLPVAGYRYYSHGSLLAVGSYGYYWSATVDGTSARGLYFISSTASMTSRSRAYGYSVRCLKD